MYVCHYHGSSNKQRKIPIKQNTIKEKRKKEKKKANSPRDNDNICIVQYQRKQSFEGALVMAAWKTFKKS